MMARAKELIVGGAGNQGRLYKDLLSQQSDLVEKILVYDPNLRGDVNRSWIINKFPDDVTVFDIALITIPHSFHFEMTRHMLDLGKHVIKEKPLACSSEDARSLINQTVEKRLSLFTTTQRPYTLMFKRLKDKVIPSEVHSFHYIYQKNFLYPDTGWRSLYKYCRGGVLLDMGYHIIDLLNRLFDLPVRVTASFGYFFEECKSENLEDTALLTLDYGNCKGTVKISRHDYSKMESFNIVTHTHSIQANTKEITVRGRNGDELIECLDDIERLVLVRMLKFFLQNISNQEFIRSELELHFKNVLLIDALYKSAKLHKWIELSELLEGEKVKWKN